MSNVPVPDRRYRRVFILIRLLTVVAALVACAVLAGSSMLQRKTRRVASREPASPAFPFRTAVVRCSDADVSDDYRFEITSGRDGAFQIGITDATAPPFVLSRSLAREAGVGRIDGLLFGGERLPMPPLVRAGSANVDVVLRGQLRSLQAERYATSRDAWPDSGELLLLRDLGEDRDVNVVARLSRGGMVVVELRSLE